MRQKYKKEKDVPMSYWRERRISNRSLNHLQNLSPIIVGQCPKNSTLSRYGNEKGRYMTYIVNSGAVGKI